MTLTPRGWLAAALAWPAAAGLALSIVATNHNRACLNQEWTFGACRKPESAVAALREAFRRDPGDASAYARLATLQGEGSPQLLKNAALLAPRNPNIAFQTAQAAAADGDWVVATALLVNLAEQSDDPSALFALARLVAAGRSDLLEPHLRPHSRWTRKMISALRQIPGALPSGAALVSMAVKQEALRPEELSDVIQTLIDQGAWVDAYGLWASLHPEGLPLLRDGEFSTPLDEGPFGWRTDPTPQHRSGVIVERVRDTRGQYNLEATFTGRRVAMPMLQQDVFAGEGVFRLSGQMLTSRLRVEDGVQWTLRCRAGNGTISSPPVKATGAEWEDFVFDFSMPAGCGPVTSLEFGLSERDATGGASGRISLRSLALKRLSG